MKKNLFRIALAGVLFAGLSFLSTTNQVNAQNNTLVDNLYNPPTGSFVTPAVALVRLEQAMAPLKLIMDAYSAGGPQYDQAFRKYSYFDAVSNAISEGKTVPVSIVDGLKAVETDAYSVPRKTLYEYKQEAINLLKL